MRITEVFVLILLLVTRLIARYKTATKKKLFIKSDLYFTKIPIFELEFSLNFEFELDLDLDLELELV